MSQGFRTYLKIKVLSFRNALDNKILFIFLPIIPIILNMGGECQIRLLFIWKTYIWRPSLDGTIPIINRSINVGITKIAVLQTCEN